MKKECNQKFPASNLTITGVSGDSVWVNTPDVMNQVVQLSELPRTTRFITHGGSFEGTLGDTDLNEIGSEIRTFMDKSGKPRIKNTMENRGDGLTNETKLFMKWIVQNQKEEYEMVKKFIKMAKPDTDELAEYLEDKYSGRERHFGLQNLDMGSVDFHLISEQILRHLFGSREKKFVLSKPHLIEGAILREGTIIKVLSEKIIDVNSQKQFILNNIELAGEYDLQDLYKKLFTARFKADTGSYIDLPRTGREWIVSSLNFSADESLSYDEVLAKFNSHTGPMDTEDRWEKENLQGVARTVYADKRPGTYRLSGMGYGMSSFLQLLDYGLEGTKEKDFKKYYDIIQKYELESIMAPGFDWIEIPEIRNGLMLKRFKNGNLQVKGASPAELDNIQRILDSLR